MIEQPYHETLLTWWVLQDVESVEQRLTDFRDIEQARRMSNAVNAPQAVWNERADVLQRLARAALGGEPDAFRGLTPEELAAEVEEIDRRVMRRRLVS